MHPASTDSPCTQPALIVPVAHPSRQEEGCLTEDVHEVGELARLLALLELDVELAQAVERELVCIDEDLLRLPSPMRFRTRVAARHSLTGPLRASARAESASQVDCDSRG
eukprot:2198428-Rhodomonas_salina.1